MRTLKLVAVLSVAGAMSLVSALPVQAAPITPLSAAAKLNTQDGGSTIQVRWWGWRGGGFGWGVGALAAGALIGAAIATSPYTYGGYYPYSGYGYPYSGYGYGYGYPYGYSSAYYPSYSYGYYRPIRRFHVVHHPYWRHSFGMYRGRHFRHW